MFTGLVEQQGIVVVNEARVNAHRLIIEATLKHPQDGESIAVNGVCLTRLIESSSDLIAFDVSPETLARTNLGEVNVGDKVNIERAMLASARFGGHYVSGHIDATAVVVGRLLKRDYLELTLEHFSIPALLYLIPKGSITLDGVSLTINEVEQEAIKVLLIPHTLMHTTLGARQIGSRINVEFDYLTRVVAHQLRLNYDKSI